MNRKWVVQQYYPCSLTQGVWLTVSPYNAPFCDTHTMSCRLTFFAAWLMYRMLTDKQYNKNYYYRVAYIPNTYKGLNDLFFKK